MEDTGYVRPSAESVPNDTQQSATAAPAHGLASRLRTLHTKPVALGALLALIGMNVSTVRPAWGIDSSFRVGLTDAVLDRLRFGVDVVWPYGPLGFLAGPTAIDRGLLAIAVVYQFAALTALFTALVVQLARLGLGRIWSMLVLAPFALAVSLADNLVPEIVTAALIVVLMVLWHGSRPGLPSPTGWVLGVAGFVAGAQVLVKFGPGVVACAVVLWFAVASGRRFRDVPVAVAAILVGFFVAWVATGQAMSALGPYIRSSLELSSGYQEAQAWGPYGGRMAVIGVLTVIVAALGVFGAWRWARVERRAWWALVPLAAAAWFTLKQGLVRWDSWHVVGALLVLGLLVASLRWERRLIALPIGVLVVGAVATFATEPSRLRTTWSSRVEAAGVLMSSGRQAAELSEARAELLVSYDVPAEVVEALAGGTVHAEEWDVNAVWANGLEWDPLPVFQSYSTYTAELDRINATRYASSSGPDGVLLSPVTVDDRYGLWESPDARVALTCNFVSVVATEDWTALRRGPNVCGRPQELRTDRVAPGETVDVPEPSRPDALVIARFDLPSNPVGWILATFARPVQYAEAMVDGTPYRLVTGTAADAHIVRSPGRIGDRELPHGRVDHSTLSFANVGSGTITVRFEEIPLDAS